MTLYIETCLLPQLVRQSHLGDSTVVIIDVLRASTTMIHALAAGARAVIPCETVKQARDRVARLRGKVVLGGERGGLPIKGFTLGNSPSEYTADRVQGAWVVFTTTNGTRALKRCAAADRLVIGAFANHEALCDGLPTEGRVVLVCAGTEGRVSYEDVLFAGAVIARLCERWAHKPVLNDASMLAHHAWHHAAAQQSPTWTLADQIMLGRGASNLTAVGLSDDVHTALQWNRFPVVPRWDARAGTVCLR